MAKKKILRLIAVIIGVLSVFSLINYWAGDIISLERLQLYHQPMKVFVETNFILSSIIFMITFVSLSSLSLPVISLGLLLIGSVFPLVWALCLGFISFFFHCLVMVAGVRYLFRGMITRRYQLELEKINQNIEKNGIYYVIFLRLSLLVPSPIINMAAGLTTINNLLFSVVSTICFIPVISMLVYSGKLLVTINTLWDLYSHQNLIILITLAIASLGLLWVMKQKEKKEYYVDGNSDL